MNDYDFSTLNDKEFENISLDLISRDRDKRYERFKVGKDGGVDGRFYKDDGKEEIVQCKHYLKTGLAGLISSLKKKNSSGNTESDKVKILNPKRYIFITSLPLSRTNKQEIKDIFKPYIRKDNDIYGQEDLNDLLKNNSDIEENHYKLWISSTTVLKRIMNNAIKGRSEFLLASIKDKSKFYVLTDNHNKALKNLEKAHVVIIAGEPGIGKTTLANHLALKYIEKGFEFYSIENSINEAEDIFEPDTKQFFYFDDFLGANYLEAIENKKDSHIMSFIERIKKNKNKRFVLTSRTNIFNRGLLLSDTFKNKHIEKDEFIIKIDTLKDIDKARILYNHIWHSSLNEDYIDELYKDKRYKVIINHKNFNPRIIEFITNIDTDIVSGTEYWSYIQDKLNNPSDIWKNTFDIQSDEFVRSLVSLTVFNGNEIEEEALKSAYKRYSKLIKLQNPSHISKEFDSVIEEVVKYFLNRTQKYDKSIEYSLFNPSIADFILNRYGDDGDRLIQIYLSLHSVKSLNNLYSSKGNRDTYQIILTKLHEELDIGDFKSIDYAIELLLMVELEKFKEPIDKTKRNSFFQSIIDNPRNFDLIDEFITILTYMDTEDIEITDYGFVLTIIENSDNSENDINKIIELLTHFDINDDKVNDALNILVQDYLVLGLDSYVSDLSIDDVSYEHDEEGYAYANNDDIESYMEGSLSNLILEIDEYTHISIDKGSVMDTISIEEVNEKLSIAYMESLGSEDYCHKDVMSDNIDSIDDLFER